MKRPCLAETEDTGLTARVAEGAKGNGSDGSMDQTKDVAAASSKMREDHHALELQWLAEYNKKVTTYSGQKVQRTGNELGSAEDNFVNAGI